MRTVTRRGAWSACALVAMLAMTLGVAACGVSSTAKTPPPTVTASPTATRRIGGAGAAPPTASLTWTPVTLPAGVSLSAATDTAVSPVDGHFAWLCAPTDATATPDPNATSATFIIWATSDAGATWTQEGQLTHATDGSATCHIVADAASTHALLASVSWGCGECGTLTGASLYSSNDGATWIATPGLSLGQEVATLSGVTFAIGADTAAPQSEAAFGLVVSWDNFRSWRFIRPSGLSSQDGFFHFWLSPDGATLVAASYNGALWRTEDQGATWTLLTSSGSQQTTNGVWLKQRNSFLFCTAVDPTTNTVACSDDNGASWSKRSTPTTTTACEKCGDAPTQTTPCGLEGLTPDGALIADCPSAPGAFVVYRMALGATTWSAVASVQGASILAIPAAGPIWGVNGTPDGISGCATASLPV